MYEVRVYNLKTRKIEYLTVKAEEVKFLILKGYDIFDLKKIEEK